MHVNESKNDPIKLQVRRVFQEAQKVLKCPNPNGNHLCSTLKQMTSFLPQLQKSCNERDLPLTLDSMSEGSTLFMTGYYSQWLQVLVNFFAVDSIEKLPRGQVPVLVDVFFLHGLAAESFTVLIRNISNNGAGYRLNKCISLLETFISGRHLARLLWDQCELGAVRAQAGRGGKVDMYTNDTWHELVQQLSSVPERITNKLNNQTSDVFYPNEYVPLLLGDLLATLRRVHDSLNSNHACSVEFLSKLLGKLCLSGYGDRVWSILMPHVVTLMEADFVWCRVWEGLVVRVSDHELEAVATPMIKAAPWYGTVNKILANSVVTSQKMNYLLTNKLLLLRHFKEDKVAQNVIGYLASSPSRKHLYIKVINSLLQVWGDASAIRHTAYDQQQYICRCVLICIAFLDESTVAQHKDRLTQHLLTGMQPHLDSPILSVRRLGMIVAENLSSKVHPSGEHKLTFEYEHDTEIEHLLSLLTPPCEPQLPPPTPDGSRVSQLQRKLEDTHVGMESSSTRTETSDTEEDLDSDDDLTPYDLSNDKAVPKVKAPVYIRDCMEGVMSSDDPHKVEACLLVAERLIREHPLSVKEVAVEFSKILIHLTDTTNMDGFRLLRHGSMVALTVAAPIEVAEYLSKQFYAKNYNLRQRMDILEVLGAAAQELSRPKEPSLGKTSIPMVHPIEKAETAEPEHWRQVVQRRIDSNTRRLTRGRQQPELAQVANRFAPVAGHFFFPLLNNFDRPQATLDLMGEDHIVLSRLLYTTGLIVYAAKHAPVVRQMATSMMEFVWVVRFHCQPSVRQAALFAISMVILALPAFMLLNELNKETAEAKVWLQDVVQTDVDKDCQKMALQALVLLENICKEEFGGLSKR